MKRTQKLFGNWWVAIGAPLVLGLVMAACEGPVESTSHNYEAKLYPESTIWVQGAGASINFNAKVLKDGKEDSAAGLSYWQASGMDNGTTVSGGTLQIAATQIGNSITVTGVNTVLGISASTTVTAVSQADMYNALKALRDSSGDFIAKLKAVPGVNASLVSNGAASFYTAQISTQLSSLPSVWNPGSESQSNAENFVRIVRDINNILKQNEGRDQSAEEELVREFNNARTNAGTKDQFIAALIPLLTEANFRTLWPNNTHLTTGKYELYAVFDDGQKKNVAALMYNTSTFGALETVKSAITGAIGQVQSLALNTLASQYQGKSASELLDFLNRTNFILMGFTDDEWQKFNNLTPAQKMDAAQGLVTEARNWNGSGLQGSVVDGLSDVPGLETLGGIRLTSVQPDDGSPSSNTTSITLTFSADPSGLMTGDISVSLEHGSASASSLSGSGTSRTLEISINSSSVAGPQNLSVSVNKQGFSSTAKTCAVIYIMPVTINATADGSLSATTTRITLTGLPTGTTTGDLTLQGASNWTRGTLSGSNLTVTHSTSITPGEENGVTVTFQKNYYQMATSGAIDLYYIKDVGNFTAGASRADGKTNAQTDTITLTFGDLPSSLSYFNATDFTVTGASLDSIGPLSIYGGSIINGSLQGGTIELSVSSVTGAVGVTFAKQYYANKTASAAGVSTGAITVMNVTADENGSSTATGNLTITLDTAIDWYGLSITTGVSGLTVPNTGSVTNSNSQTLTVTNSMSSPSTDNITSGNFSMSGTGYTFTNSGFLGVQVGNP